MKRIEFQHKEAKIRLVPVCSSDIPYLLQLRKLTMLVHLEKAGLFLTEEEHHLRNNEAFDCAHIILLSNKRVGMLKFRERENTIEIMQLQIDPFFQGQGIGKNVLQKMLHDSKSKLVQLTVLKDNPAKRLYQSLGFFVTGEDDYEYHMEIQPNRGE